MLFENTSLPVVQRCRATMCVRFSPSFLPPTPYVWFMLGHTPPTHNQRHTHLYYACTRGQHLHISDIYQLLRIYLWVQLPHRHCATMLVLPQFPSHALPCMHASHPVTPCLRLSEPHVTLRTKNPHPRSSYARHQYIKAWVYPSHETIILFLH